MFKKAPASNWKLAILEAKMVQKSTKNCFKIDHKAIPKATSKRKQFRMWFGRDFGSILEVAQKQKSFKTLWGVFKITLCVYTTSNVNKDALGIDLETKNWPKIDQKLIQNRFQRVLEKALKIDWKKVGFGRPVFGVSALPGGVRGASGNPTL